MSNLSGFVKRLRDIMRNDAGINGDAQRIEQIAWMLFLKVYDAKEQDWAFDDERYVSILPEVCRWANWAHDDKSGSATASACPSKNFSAYRQNSSGWTMTNSACAIFGMPWIRACGK